MKTRIVPLLTLALLAALSGARAQAEEFLFNFSGGSFNGGLVSGQGVLDGTYLSPNEWQITAARGTLNGLPLSLSGGYMGDPDQILYTGPGSGGYDYGFPFDQYGIGFSNSQFSVLLACGSLSHFQPDCEMFAPLPYGISDFNFTYKQVPEPGTLALLALALAILGVCTLRRRQLLARRP
jgi:PEP-CTERM motif